MSVFILFLNNNTQNIFGVCMHFKKKYQSLKIPSQRNIVKNKMDKIMLICILSNDK